MVVIQHAPAATDSDCALLLESESARLIQMLTSHPIPIPHDIFPRKPVPQADVSDHTGISSLVDHDKAEEEAPSEDVVKDMYVTSIYFQEYDGLSSPLPGHPVQHRFGAKAIEEQLGKCTFQISPGAFFQVNTAGAEILFNLALEELKQKRADDDDTSNTAKYNDTLLLDVCCGTGTIGLTCMKEGFIDHLVGVDISEPAIEDAKINAQKNGFGHGDNESTKFIASRAEKVLEREIKAIRKNKETNILAVVDPAREGLHNDVLRTLRMNEPIQRLVYVSCNPTGSLVRDAAMLCAPPTKRYPGLPFKIIRAQPVDMFPLTPHCEMVMTFERMTPEECGLKMVGEKAENNEVLKCNEDAEATT